MNFAAISNNPKNWLFIKINKCFRCHIKRTIAATNLLTTAKFKFPFLLFIVLH